MRVCVRVRVRVREMTCVYEVLNAAIFSLRPPTYDGERNFVFILCSQLPIRHCIGLCFNAVLEHPLFFLFFSSFEHLSQPGARTVKGEGNRLG